MKKRDGLVLLAVTCVLGLITVQTTNGQSGPFVWTQNLSNNARIYAIAVHPTDPGIIYVAGLDSGVYKTTNAGLSWSAVNSGLAYNKVQALAISPSSPNILYAGTDQNGGSNSGMYITTNAGGSWALINNGITDSKGIQAIVVNPSDPNTAIIAVFDGLVNSTVGLFKTTNAGGTWFAANAGVGPIKNFLSLALNPLNGNTIYAGTSFNPSTSRGPSALYKSTDGGQSWVLSNSGLPKDTLTIDPIRAISVSTLDTSVVLTALFVNDTAGGVFLSTNGGENWQKKHSGLPTVTGTLVRACLIRPGSVTEFFVGLDGGGTTSRGVWRTTNGGGSWLDFNGGALINTYTVRTLGFKTLEDSTLFAGAATATPPGQGVFEYSWLSTGITNGDNKVGAQIFDLLQNYPNPFNPTTRIGFQIANGAWVSLRVFDLLGREVSTLVNEQMKPGRYEVTFDGSALASGVYYYRLEAGPSVTMKKLLLLR